MIRHFLYVPFTGLGLYGGHRGSRWLRNRIKIFKQFVVPSLLNQTNQNFTLWISWRREERGNSDVVGLKNFLDEHGLESVFTYSGICFWDDKHPDEVARERLMSALHGSLAEVVNYVGDVDDVLMTIQPSDDLYEKEMVAKTQEALKDSQAVGYKHGYIINYLTKEIREYNPSTNPPFFTIKFSKEDFIDPFKHAQHTAIKQDVGKYKAGTPYPSHEYLKDVFGVAHKYLEGRGFTVGCHGENISTHFNHPYGGDMVSQETLETFGVHNVEPLKIRISVRKWIMRKLPHNWQRKLRYWFGEKLYARFYNFIRS